MLVLSRNVGEKIVIAESVTVTVIKVRGGNVILAIDAPKEMRVRRSEVPDKEKK